MPQPVNHDDSLQPHSPRVVVLMGVSGAGKTTIGQQLARKLGWDFCDGDDLHSGENIAKMARGSPLTDDDRAGWLNRMRDSLGQWMRQGGHVVLAASLLRATHRTRVLAPWRSQILLVYLSATPATLAQRLAQRPDHFMKEDMLAGQLAILETPDDAMVVDAAEPAESIVRKIQHAISA